LARETKLFTVMGVALELSSIVIFPSEVSNTAEYCFDESILVFGVFPREVLVGIEMGAVFVVIDVGDEFLLDAKIITARKIIAVTTKVLKITNLFIGCDTDGIIFKWVKSRGYF
jgi:hypothetical protein